MSVNLRDRRSILGVRWPNQEFCLGHSTVTDFARLRGMSMSQPFFNATW
jgi:hypothetical protein